MVSRTRRECWQRYEHMSSGGTTRPQGRRAPSYAGVLPLALRASMPVCVARERSLRSELWLDRTRIRPRARKRGCCIGPWPWKGRQMHGSAETTSTQARTLDAHAMAHGAYPTATFVAMGTPHSRFCPLCHSHRSTRHPPRPGLQIMYIPFSASMTLTSPMSQPRQLAQAFNMQTISSYRAIAASRGDIAQPIDSRTRA